MIEYCSRKIEYKKPFGALRSYEAMALRLRVTDEKPSRVQLVWSLDEGKEHKVTMTPGTDGWYSLQISFSEPGLYFYRFEIQRGDGSILFVGRGEGGRAVIGDWLPRWRLAVYEKEFKTPDAFKGGLMYQIFPDRFARVSDEQPSVPTPEKRYFHSDPHELPYDYSDPARPGGRDYYGGSLAGVRAKLPYLKKLGVTVLYFNPIFQSAENHRYSTADYRRVDPYFGTNEEFAEFCKLAEQNGIKVILDGVFSHTGADSVYFNKYGHYPSLGAYNSPDSPYYSWYQFEEYPDRYAGWWGFESLPNVCETDPGYLEFVTGENGVLPYWQGQGASGWRLDVADELPDAFLTALRKRVKSTDPDALIIGEVWENAVEKISYGARRKFLLGGQCDSVMNYPWRSAIIQFVRDGNVSSFAEAIETLREDYPAPALDVLMNILSTHDTCRILTELGGREVPRALQGGFRLSPEERSSALKKLRLAALLQFTLPGIPCIYYGDEIGMEGFADPFCRAYFNWDESNNTLHSYYAELGQIRARYADDFAGKFEFTKCAEGEMIFRRGNRIEVVVNMGEREMPVDGVLLATAPLAGGLLPPGEGCICTLA